MVFRFPQLNLVKINLGYNSLDVYIFVFHLRIFYYIKNQQNIYPNS